MPGHVYLIHGVDTPWYKIGLSVNAKIRLKQLGTQGPFGLKLIRILPVDDMFGVEAHFHQMFSDKRTHGEWFSLSPEDVTTFCEWQEAA